MMSHQPKDRFSLHASSYAAFRPTYPKELYDFILAQVPKKETAWDCATGNGQVARDLSPYFNKICATDLSAKQLEHAVMASNIEYSLAAAEKTPFQDSVFDLITVGQALHWFDLPAFYKEVRRVGKPSGILAVWGYGLLKINPELDKLISDFYVNVIGPYWDAERKLVDDQYKSIPFPFNEIKTPEFQFNFEWTLQQLEGYITTWSSVRKFIKVNGENPVDALMSKVRKRWKAELYKIDFPLFLRMGRIS